MDQHAVHPEHGQGPTVEVSVLGPTDPEARPFSFKKNELVGDAAKTAAEALGYRAQSPTFQDASKHVLDRMKNLAASGVKDGDVLELVDAGGGV